MTWDGVGWVSGSWDDEGADEATLGSMFGGQAVSSFASNPDMTKKCTCSHYEAGHDSVGCEICDPDATGSTSKKTLKCREFTAVEPSVTVMLYFCKDCACANILHKDMTQECQSITACGCKKYTPGGGSTTYVGRTCDHWREDPMEVGKGIIHASAFSDRPYKDDNWLTSVDPPDLGVYLSEGWLKAFGGAAYGVTPIYKPPYPYLYIPWPDMGIIPTSFMQRLTTRIAGYMSRGKTVEIACMGGHGRTGTLVAAVVGQVTGWDAKKSIEWVRTSHCDKALESNSQIDAVYETLDEEPPKHTPSPSKKTYATQWTGAKKGTMMPPSTWHEDWAGDRCMCMHLRKSHWTVKLREQFPESPAAKLRTLEDSSCFRCDCDGWDLGKLAGSF